MFVYIRQAPPPCPWQWCCLPEPDGWRGTARDQASALDFRPACLERGPACARACVVGWCMHGWCMAACLPACLPACPLAACLLLSPAAAAFSCFLLPLPCLVHGWLARHGKTSPLWFWRENPWPLIGRGPNAAL